MEEFFFIYLFCFYVSLPFSGEYQREMMKKYSSRSIPEENASQVVKMTPRYREQQLLERKRRDAERVASAAKKRAQLERTRRRPISAHTPSGSRGQTLLSHKSRSFYVEKESSLDFEAFLAQSADSRPVLQDDDEFFNDPIIDENDGNGLSSSLVDEPPVPSLMEVDSVLAPSDLANPSDDVASSSSNIQDE